MHVGECLEVVGRRQALRSSVGVQITALTPDTCVALGKLFQLSSLIFFFLFKMRKETNVYLRIIYVHMCGDLMSSRT